MRKLLLIAVVTVISISSFATELNYQWKSGAAYHFTAIVDDNVSSSVMGMEMNEKFKTTTDFVLYINSVNGEGSANGILYLVNFRIEDSRGGLLASLKDLPEKALKSDVQVDRKGNFKFPKKIYMITSAGTNVLAYGSADQNSVSVGGQAGNLKVDAYAEFDPKTGALKTGYTASKINETHEVNIKIDQETDQIDVLPYDFLELLSLPEGDVNLNDEYRINAGVYDLLIKVNSMTNGVASLHHTMGTDKSKDMFDGGASAKSGDGNQMFGMTMDTDFEDSDLDMDSDLDSDMDFDDMDVMGGMPGMTGMTTEDQAALAMTKSMAPQMNGEVTSRFDYQNGMFKNVVGTMNTEVNTMGMKITIVSKLQMVLN